MPTNIFVEPLNIIIKIKKVLEQSINYIKLYNNQKFLIIDFKNKIIYKLKTIIEIIHKKNQYNIINGIDKLIRNNFKIKTNRFF